MLTTLVENFPGFPEGIQGPELMQNMRKQAEHFGAEFLDEDFVSADFSVKPFKVTASDKTYEGKSVIIATGADTKWLGVPGEKEKIGRGVSSCAPCDAVFFRNKNVIVVGGGDSAMEEALVLTKFATSVTLIHRKDEFKALCRQCSLWSIRGGSEETFFGSGSGSVGQNRHQCIFRTAERIRFCGDGVG